MKAIRTAGKRTARRGANHHRRVKLRRESRRHWLRGLGWKGLLAIACAAALMGASGYGGRKAFRAYRDGRILTVQRIEVAGNSHWETSRLLESAGLEVGAEMPGISARSAREALLRLPGIREARVRPSLGGKLRVEIVEEEVLALRAASAPGPSRRNRAAGGGWEGLTPSGAWMPLRGAEDDAPVVDVPDSGFDSAALARFLGAARSRYPGLCAGFSQIVVRGRDEADIYWRDGAFMARVDYANKSLNSLEFLRALLAREKSSWPPGSTVDLRVEGYAYVL